MLKACKRRSRALTVHRCAAAVAGLIIGGAYASGQNLLLDPGFEAGIAGAPNAALGDVSMSTSGPWLGWNNWVSPYSGYYANAANDGFTAHTGSQVGKTFSGPNAGLYQFAAVTGGEAYTASAWFDNSTTDALEAAQTCDVRMTFFSGANGTGNNLGLVIAPVTVTSATPQNTWTQLMVQAAAPAGAASVQWLAFFNNPLYNGGSMFVDDASLLDTSWNGGGTDDNWSDNNNWGGVAPGQYAPLVFAGTNQLVNNNDFPTATPFYGIAFQPSAGSFTLNGNQVNLASDVVNNSANTQTIALGLGLQQNTNFNTAAGNVVVTGAISGTFALTKLGAKTLTISGANTYSGGTNVNAGTLIVGANGALPDAPVAINGATLQLGTGTGLAEISSLSISGNGTLDITNNHLIINYGAGADPIDSIATLIQSGYNHGTWKGPGITSSAAAANSGSYGIGYADGASGAVAGLSSGQIELMYTLLGDANLDGKVNGADFILMAANFNDSVTAGWDQGDFNYDSVVNGNDFVLLADNFNDFASQSDVSAADLAAVDAFAASNGISLTSVPEPASTSLLLIGAASLFSRRRSPRRAQPA
jgi:autotransporter-associated beta strand protein